MSALTADRHTPYRNVELIEAPVAAGAVIHAGALVAANAAGYAAPGESAANITALGRAEEPVDNSAGADGDARVRVRRGKAFLFANDGADPVTQAGLGKACYIVDDQTVAATDGAATLSVAGTVLGVEADGVWVLI